MSNTKDFFLIVTQRVFSNWTALRLAVEHGMGTKECAVEFCPYITEFMFMNDKLDSDDIARELEDYMDANFRTELEDDSSVQVAHELLRFHRYCSEENNDAATNELAKLPPLQPWILTPNAIREMNKQPSTVQCESSSVEDNANDNEMDTDHDGQWVTVGTRRNK